MKNNINENMVKSSTTDSNLLSIAHQANNISAFPKSARVEYDQNKNGLKQSKL